MVEKNHRPQVWPSAYLTIINVPPEEWCAAVLQRERLVGRGQESPIRIPPRFAYVSRRHAAVWADRHGLWIRDVGSSAGTHVNGVWLKPDENYQFALGDRIWLGGVEIEGVAALGPLPEIIAEMGLQRVSDGEETERFQRRTTTVPPAVMLNQLSHAELEVVLWMCRGYTHLHEIGRKLHRSPNTVRTQLGSIFGKLGVHSREELIGWLQRESVLNADGPPAATT